MAKKLYEESNIQAIADAIRSKNGTTDTYKVSEMAGAIGAIEAGVADPRVKEIIERTITEISDDSITKLGDYAFSYCQQLKTVTFPNVIVLGNNVFYSCKALQQVVCPRIANIGRYAFYNCANLSVVDFPQTTTIDGNAFNSCSKVTKAVFPLVTSIGFQAFVNNRLLTTLIIGTTDCVLVDINAFSNTPIKKGTGFIYVPDGAVEAYKTATNWSTYADQIKGISELPQE